MAGNAEEVTVAVDLPAPVWTMAERLATAAGLTDAAGRHAWIADMLEQAMRAIEGQALVHDLEESRRCEVVLTRRRFDELVDELEDGASIDEALQAAMVQCFEDALRMQEGRLGGAWPLPLDDSGIVLQQA